MGLKEIFKKQGGLQLIKQYVRVGCLFTAINQFLVLGGSRTALEILRLSTQLKIKQKIEKNYKSFLDEFDNSYDSSLPHETSNKVWICWFQGIENAPTLVKKCYISVKSNLPNKEVILITSENMGSYVHFPNFIVDKWKKGVISHTHMTDLLRLELLIKYGGMWLDSTVLCSNYENEIPAYFFDSELFFYQSLKPGRDGKSTYFSSWLISAKSNNKILMATRALCYEYWKENNIMYDYFLLHDLMSMVLDKYEDEWKRIVPRDNATPHILLLSLFDQYDERIWNSIKEQTPFHKLSYKYDIKKNKLKGTYYAQFIEHGL